jgi:hypothetical protein
MRQSEYMRRYYAANKHRWRLSEEQKEERNRKRRERYASDESFRDKCKQQSRKRCKTSKREYALKENYGIGSHEYEEMLRRQEGKCGICGAIAADARGCRLHVDHCHNTGAVRGLLCSNCNHGIGKFSDCPERLEQAAMYLRAHERRQSSD